MRICSLLPSATEIVAELGLADALVAVSEECDRPPEVRALPRVTASRVDTRELGSAAIDRAVRDALADGRSLYALDAALVAELAPDLVLTQDLCAVCAVSAGQVREVSAVPARTLSLDPRTFADVEESVRAVAAALGVPDRGEEVAARMRERVERVRSAVRGRRRPRVVVAEWLDPPFASGHWLPEMVEAAGGRELLGRAGEPSRRIAWADVDAARPDLVVVAPCGFDAERAAREAAGRSFPCRAIAVDANAYYARPAPRLAVGVEQLGSLLHPDAVPDPGLPAIQLRRAATAA